MTFATPLVWLCVALTGVFADAVPEIDALDLQKRGDLVGKEVIVDGRVAYFQNHDGIFDEVYLKKTTATFRLPAELRTRQAPDAAGVRLQGILRKESGVFVMDVTRMTQLPGDMERLRQGIAQLTANDFENRYAWARWARRRGTDFGEPALREKAAALCAEGIRLEAARPGMQQPDATLRLARKARDLGAPEPEPSALVHRALRTKLSSENTATGFEQLVKDAEELLPASQSPAPVVADLNERLATYEKEPDDSYRRAPEGVRRALDRRLYIDLVQKAFERHVAEHPDEALSLADRAREKLPDRPAVANALEADAIEHLTDDVHLNTMRRVELDGWIKRFQARNEPRRTEELKRRWLTQQRRRISPSDAEDRVTLAGLYETMLNDRASAVQLLREAWKIDPQSKEIPNAFRRLGYRKVGDSWEEAKGGTEKPKNDAEPAKPASRVDATAEPLRNLTRTEVRSQLGEPTSVARSASQGDVLEQWIYNEGNGRVRYVNFRFRVGMAQPLVERSYSIRSP
jgi:tetratricopeptide (TPR) repeat protein